MTYHKIDWNDDEEAMDAVRAVLVGRKATVVDNETLELDNGVRLLIEGNDGCGGCPSGYYQLEELNGVDNAIMAVEFDRQDDEYSEPEVFRIFVYTENAKIKLAEVAGSIGNGYYGSGYYVHVKLPEGILG